MIIVRVESWCMVVPCLGAPFVAQRSLVDLVLYLGLAGDPAPFTILDVLCHRGMVLTEENNICRQNVGMPNGGCMLSVSI